MTLAFVGRTTPRNGERIAEAVARFKQKLRGANFDLSAGEVKVLGRNGNLLAIVFPIEQVPAEIQQEIRALKVELAMLGVPVDQFFDQQFLPHVTFGTLPATTYATGGDNPFQEFVADGMVGDELRRIAISGEIDLLSREFTAPGQSDPSYNVVALPSLEEVL